MSRERNHPLTWLKTGIEPPYPIPNYDKLAFPPDGIPRTGTPTLNPLEYLSPPQISQGVASVDQDTPDWLRSVLNRPPTEPPKQSWLDKYLVTNPEISDRQLETVRGCDMSYLAEVLDIIKLKAAGQAVDPNKWNSLKLALPRHQTGVTILLRDAIERTSTLQQQPLNGQRHQVNRHLEEKMYMFHNPHALAGGMTKEEAAVATIAYVLNDVGNLNSQVVNQDSMLAAEINFLR